MTVEVFARWAQGELADALRGTGVDVVGVRVYENADAFGGFVDRHRLTRGVLRRLAC